MIDGHRHAVTPDVASSSQQVVDADEAVLVIRDNRQTRVASSTRSTSISTRWTMPAARP